MTTEISNTDDGMICLRVTKDGMTKHGYVSSMHLVHKKEAELTSAIDKELAMVFEEISHLENDAMAEDS